MTPQLAKTLADLAFEQVGDICAAALKMRYLALDSFDLASELARRKTVADELLAITPSMELAGELVAAKRCDEVIRGRFVDLAPQIGKQADVILMDMPAEDLKDHIACAYHRWLAPGGVLGAVAPLTFMADMDARIPSSSSHFAGDVALLIARKGE